MSNEPTSAPPPDRVSARAERQENTLGLIIILILALLTILEFLVAIAVDDSLWLIIGLTPFALGKAVLIFWYFMHIYKLWQGEEDHA